MSQHCSQEYPCKPVLSPIKHSLRNVRDSGGETDEEGTTQVDDEKHGFHVPKQNKVKDVTTHILGQYHQNDENITNKT